VKRLAITLTLWLTAATAGAQSLARVASGIPAWADSAFANAGLGTRYALTSGVNPDVRWGDFDGDGFLDVALGIVDGSRRRGIAFIHRIDRSVHIVGAGQPVGNGRDELPVVADWGVQRLRSHRDAIRVDGSGDWKGWIVWNGQSYVWVQDAD